MRWKNKESQELVELLDCWTVSLVSLVSFCLAVDRELCRLFKTRIVRYRVAGTE
jgi:hypothetical protein